MGEPRKAMIQIHLNDTPRELDADPEMPLLWALHDTLRMTGTKFGCGLGVCGACTVLIDGAPARACQTPVGGLGSQKVTTIEGLRGSVATAVQDAWTRLDVPQCGYCQSGQVLAATALLVSNRAPTDDDIDEAMGGNLCRCATYHRIRSAIHSAAALLGKQRETA
jgi:isoquinoline 1-oxidoreductase alpha subunit